MFRTADTVASSYSYSLCVTRSYAIDGSSICTQSQMARMELEPLTSPFIYHWQCASVLLAAYVPVFIYTNVFQFAYPIMILMFSFVKYSSLPVWTRAKLPGEYIVAIFVPPCPLFCFSVLCA